jgi:hypothetical protein
MDIRSLLDCDLYVTDFPQGISVIWKPLSLKDHKRFQALVQRGFLTEDEANSYLTFNKRTRKPRSANKKSLDIQAYMQSLNENKEE